MTDNLNTPEILKTRTAADDIQCITCHYASDNPKSCNCKLYTGSNIKPDDVYYNGKECEFYKSK